MEEEQGRMVSTTLHSTTLHPTSQQPTKTKVLIQFMMTSSSEDIKTLEQHPTGVLHLHHLPPDYLDQQYQPLCFQNHQNQRCYGRWWHGKIIFVILIICTLIFLTRDKGEEEGWRPNPIKTHAVAAVTLFVFTTYNKWLNKSDYFSTLTPSVVHKLSWCDVRFQIVTLGHG